MFLRNRVTKFYRDKIHILIIQFLMRKFAKMWGEIRITGILTYPRERKNLALGQPYSLKPK